MRNTGSRSGSARSTITVRRHHRRADLSRRPLFVPVPGVSEEGQGGQQKYECCTFAAAYPRSDASTGQVI
jgi:hypothetical protein